jgi:cytochrome c biogenesis protein CcmG/thiol:disulfide interchange protein DsbE
MADHDDHTPDTKRSGLSLMHVIPLAVLLVIAGLSAYVLSGDPADREILPSTLIAKPVPQMDLPPLHDGAARLSTATLQEPGVKIVNIWASWCGPCRVEHPRLMELATMGIPVYGINYKDDGDKARKFLTDLGDPFTTVGEDSTGRMGIEWGVYGVPETFVINGEGRIAYKHVGPIQNDDLERVILPAMRAAGWKG